MWLNWVVLTGWNVGCLPLALLIGASRARKRVLAKAKPGLEEKQAKGGEAAAGVGDVESQGQDGLQDLGNVALMGA